MIFYKKECIFLCHRITVTMVMGIPTVKRPIESYLIQTLENLIENMDEREREDALIIVCIAEVNKVIFLFFRCMVISLVI